MTARQNAAASATRAAPAYDSWLAASGGIRDTEVRDDLWLVQVPDITVKMCTALLGPLTDANKNYSTEIVTQMLPSEAAFVISNSDKVEDDIAVYTAGVEGSLRAYESILKAKPKARWSFLDDLIQKREKGELADYIRQAATHCK